MSHIETQRRSRSVFTELLQHYKEILLKSDWDFALNLNTQILTPDQNIAESVCLFVLFIFVRVSVSDLEIVLLDDASWLQMVADLVQDRQHGDVGLTSAGRSTDEEVFIGVVGRLKHKRLDSVQTLHPLKHQLSNLNKDKERRKWV